MSVTELIGEAIADKAQRELARAAQQLVMTALDHPRAAHVLLKSGEKNGPEIALPPSALPLIAKLLGLLSSGQPFSMIPSRHELTTVEAANFLGVSRPFLIRELEAGKLPYRLVGKHRRIGFTDLELFAKSMHAAQQQALKTLMQNSNDLGLEY
jgi:excisionase family DNA binding protein